MSQHCIVCQLHIYNCGSVSGTRGPSDKLPREWKYDCEGSPCVRARVRLLLHTAPTSTWPPPAPPQFGLDAARAGPRWWGDGVSQTSAAARCTAQPTQLQIHSHTVTELQRGEWVSDGTSLSPTWTVASVYPAHRTPGPRAPAPALPVLSCSVTVARCTQPAPSHHPSYIVTTVSAARVQGSPPPLTLYPVQGTSTGWGLVCCSGLQQRDRQMQLSLSFTIKEWEDHAASMLVLLTEWPLAVTGPLCAPAARCGAPRSRPAPALINDPCVVTICSGNTSCYCPISNIGTKKETSGPSVAISDLMCRYILQICLHD